MLLRRRSHASAKPPVVNGNSDSLNPHLYFYDSISPIVEADSIDMSRVYMAARYDKGTADYINCPMTEPEYDRFLRCARCCAICRRDTIGRS